MSYETRSLHVCFFIFIFELSLKDFPFYSPIILIILRYLQTRIKESCMYLSAQLFFKTPHETPRKIQENCILQQSGDLNLKILPFNVYLPWGHPAGPLPFLKYSARYTSLNSIFEWITQPQFSNILLDWFGFGWDLQTLRII